MPKNIHLEDSIMVLTILTKLCREKSERLLRQKFFSEESFPKNNYLES